jgi:aminoglycoside phosphotransferase (APT) family kinase protein
MPALALSRRLKKYRALMDAGELRDALERFIRRESGRPLRVEHLAPLPGGASREMFGFELRETDDDTPMQMVLRLDPPPGRMQSDRGEEFRLLQLTHESGVKVPRVHWLGELSDGLGARFFVMDRVGGEAIARRLLRDEHYEVTRRALPGDLARELGRTHAVNLSDPRLATLRERAPGGDDPRRFARFEIDRYRNLLDLADQGWPRPALSFGERWLRRNAPAASRIGLVHGDFRIGNVMFDERGLTAVIDWELSHIGDPLEDIGWMTVRAWRFGEDDRPVGGLCSREKLWDLYGRETGVDVDVNAALWWEIFGNWKWTVICVLQAASHKAGRVLNVELASLGRRTAEVEWELIARIEDYDARST